MKIKDVARIAGVSPSTVSKIVNGKDASISAETREKVLDVVREYHYTPYASSLPNTKTWEIAVILRSSISLDTTLDGVIERAQNAQYATLVFNSYNDTERELKNIAALGTHKVDGIIWEPVSHESVANESHLAAMGIPVLKIGPHGGDASHMLPYEEAAYRLTEELISRGHRRIGCLMTEGRRTESFLRGFRTCLFDHGMTLDDAMIFYDLDDALVAKIADHTVTGVISSHYKKAREFLQLMEALRYRIPDDVSLVSLRNDMNEMLAYPGGAEVSTYTIRNADFGSYLCARLLTTIEKREDIPLSFVQEFHLDNTATLAAPSDEYIKRIAVVGSINIDNYLHVPRLPGAGVTVSTRSSETYPGGKGVNESVGATRLGHRVALIGNVGTDSDADYIYRALDREGVDTSGIVRRSEESTGRSFIFVDAAGDSMISIIPGANEILSAADVRAKASLIEGADSCLVQTEVPLDAVQEALGIAREHHVTTFLKPTSCGPLSNDLLSLVDVLVPNEKELENLHPEGQSIEERVAALISQGADTVIVTLGEKGSYLRSGDIEEYFPSDSTAQIDNAGAGDAFISALASYLLYGYGLADSVRIATLAAGYSVSRQGILGSLIHRDTLEGKIAHLDPSPRAPRQSAKVSDVN